MRFLEFVMSDIVVIGSLNADFVLSVERAPVDGETVIGNTMARFCGGKGANQAFAVGKLGASVAMIGRVGDDAYGETQIASLNSAGVSTDCVRRVENASTGTAIVIVEETGENRAIIIPGTNGMLDRREFERDETILDKAKFVLLQIETTLEATVAGLEAARRRGVATILDPAPAQALSSEVLRMVDYLTPNLSELQILVGDTSLEQNDETGIARAARNLIEGGARKVIAKLGSAGALLIDKDSVSRVHGYRVNAVDTTGAGDCFNAAFAVGLLRGQSELDAIDFACSAAAVAVTRWGAQQGMPSCHDVDAFRNEYEGLHQKVRI